MSNRFISLERRIRYEISSQFYWNENEKKKSARFSVKHSSSMIFSYIFNDWWSGKEDDFSGKIDLHGFLKSTSDQFMKVTEATRCYRFQAPAGSGRFHGLVARTFWKSMPVCFSAKIVIFRWSGEKTGIATTFFHKNHHRKQNVNLWKKINGFYHIGITLASCFCLSSKQKPVLTTFFLTYWASFNVSKQILFSVNFFVLLSMRNHQSSNACREREKTIHLQHCRWS